MNAPKAIDGGETHDADKVSSFGPLARAAARLAAVQALYQMEMTGVGVEAVIEEFIDNRLGQEIDDQQYASADTGLFTELLRGVVARQGEVDGLIAGALSADWPLSRLDSTLRALIRAGVYELMARPDIPAKVVLSEYTGIAHAFFSGDEPGFANGVLDGIARRVRPQALTAHERGR